MSDEPPFQPRPRRPPSHRQSTDSTILVDELTRILQRTERVAATDPASFSDGTQPYDVACMAIIRLAALLERPEFTSATERLTPDERAAIRTTRNIAAHAGYRGMNDELFWAAITIRVPQIIQRLLRDRDSD